MEKTQFLEIDRYERRTIINALDHFRDNLIKEGITTDSIDDLLLKIMNAPIKKRSLIKCRTAKGNYVR